MVTVRLRWASRYKSRNLAPSIVAVGRARRQSGFVETRNCRVDQSSGSGQVRGANREASDETIRRKSHCYKSQVAGSAPS